MKKEAKYIREEFVLTEEDSKNYNTVNLPTKSGYGIYKEFLFLNQYSLLDIVENYDLSKNGMKIFVWLLARVSTGNCIYTYLDEISRALKIAKPHISTELKHLADRNIIIKKSRLEGNQRMQMEIAFNFDRLNANIGYKGKLKASTVNKQQQLDEPILAKECIRTITKFGSVQHVHVDTGEIVWETGNQIAKQPIKNLPPKRYIKQLNFFEENNEEKISIIRKEL